MTKRLLIFLAAAVLLLGVRGDIGAKPPGRVMVVTIYGVINAGTTEYLSRGIAEAEKDDASLFVVLLDTPGGLVESMRLMAKSMLNTKTPTAVFVHPKGARAASAGVFLTLASDVAAMTPGTNIGSAHPVAGGGKEMDKEMSKKVVNDLVAFIRGLAKRKGRNEQWAEDAVRKSVSITAEEAVKLKVVDLLADDLKDLLAKVDGTPIPKDKGGGTIRVKGAEVFHIVENFRERLLKTISRPEVAYILMMVGMAGLYFELSNPGAVLPGVLGGISLILALYSFHTLPVNYAGILLIFLAMVFFILELKVTSYGMLTIAGIISLALGSIMLFKTPTGAIPLPKGVFYTTLVTVSGFFAAVTYLAAKAQLAKPLTGLEGIVGEVGEVVKEIRGRGKVFVQGEIWNAYADEIIPKGTRVKVLEVKKLLLKVAPLADRKPG